MRLVAALVALALMGAGTPERSIEAGGEHIRIETAHGAVHVWTPAAYAPATAGVALYVHGYYTDVDRAWKQHHLAEQFRASGRNALFIAPEAPDGLRQKVFWPQLGDLLREVSRQTGLRRPWGPVAALVHSGGYRTAAGWLDDERLADLVLLDALYGEEEAFADWARAPGHRILVVGADTLRWTEPFARELAMPSADQIPDDDIAPAGGHLYLRGQLGHMDLVTGGKVIPLLYRATRLPAAVPAR